MKTILKTKKYICIYVYMYIRISLSIYIDLCCVAAICFVIFYTIF